MATWDDVQRLALALPEVTEKDGHEWRVRGKLLVWERPLRRRDLEELGESAPQGPILGARVPDEGAKRALVADAPDVYFTTSHFDGYPAVLVQLDHIEADELDELIVEAWVAQAPKRLAKKYLTERADGAPSVQ
jgi:hypothetical protein